MHTPAAPVGYELAHDDPLVVLATSGDRRAIDVVAEDLGRDFPGERFIGIVSADCVDDIDAPLTSLSTLLAEVIFTASSPVGVRGDILAFHALDVVGIGQDFVFTVPELPDAIRYALDKLDSQRSQTWEGTAVIVVGPPAAVDEARRVLHPTT